MRKWSVLSIPLIGIAGLGIWAQSLVAVPDNQPTGVVVVDPAATFTSAPESSVQGPASTSSAAPDGFRPAEAPCCLDMAQPRTTEQAENQDADDAAPGDDGDPGVVQHVEPTQVTSPAAPPPGGAASDKPVDSSDLATSGGGTDD